MYVESFVSVIFEVHVEVVVASILGAVGKRIDDPHVCALLPRWFVVSHEAGKCLLDA